MSDTLHWRNTATACSATRVALELLKHVHHAADTLRPIRCAPDEVPATVWRLYASQRRWCPAERCVLGTLVMIHVVRSRLVDKSW